MIILTKHPERLDEPGFGDFTIFSADDVSTYIKKKLMKYGVDYADFYIFSDYIMVGQLTLWVIRENYPNYYVLATDEGKLLEYDNRRVICTERNKTYEAELCIHKYSLLVHEIHLRKRRIT